MIPGPEKLKLGAERVLKPRVSVGGVVTDETGQHLSTVLRETNRGAVGSSRPSRNPANPRSAGLRFSRGRPNDPAVNSKLTAGSVLTGLSLLAAVLDAWAKHFFFTMYHVARGESLEGAGSFDPGPYGARPGTAEIFVGTRILVWVALLFGLGLLVWGTVAEYRRERDL
jgi:hypothetical protein